MSPKEFFKVVQSRPLNERLAALIVTTIEAENSNAFSVCVRLVRMTARMAERMCGEDRFRLSEELRDLADKTERPQIADALTQCRSPPFGGSQSRRDGKHAVRNRAEIAFTTKAPRGGF